MEDHQPNIYKTHALTDFIGIIDSRQHQSGYSHTYCELLLLT